MREQQLNEERIKSILEQLPNYSVYVSEDELKSIKARTLIVIGDNDLATPMDCVLTAKRNIPDSFLLILPNTEHRVLQGRSKDLFIKISKDFLKIDGG
jgi:pimeloyl-ACP methyl ester carboxylesterase